jgi:hypothetical protein
MLYHGEFFCSFISVQERCWPRKARYFLFKTKE